MSVLAPSDFEEMDGSGPAVVGQRLHIGVDVLDTLRRRDDPVRRLEAHVFLMSCLGKAFMILSGSNHLLAKRRDVSAERWHDVTDTIVQPFPGFLR